MRDPDRNGIGKRRVNRRSRIEMNTNLGSTCGTPLKTNGEPQGEALRFIFPLSWTSISDPLGRDILSYDDRKDRPTFSLLKKTFPTRSASLAERYGVPAAGSGYPESWHVLARSDRD